MALMLAAAMLLSQVVAFDDAGPVDEPAPAPDETVTVDVAAPVAYVAPVAPIGVWDRLAQCESSGNWSAVSRGGTYRGGLQFDQPTWRSYGGGQYASSAHLASRTQQIDIATRLRAARGYAPWPVCRRVIGV